MNFLVTGCSRGVGLEICRALLQQGHIVYGVAPLTPMSLNFWKPNMPDVYFSKVST